MTTGASNDIEKATKCCQSYDYPVWYVSEKFGLIGLESVQHRYLDGQAGYELWSGDSI